MAYMNQAKKELIAQALKLVVPKTWKYSLAVSNHSTIIMTIKSAPINLIESCATKCREDMTYLQVNEFYVKESFSGKLGETIQKIVDALNTNNHDRSDVQSDYFDVGHYIQLNIGRWNKPFVVTAKAKVVTNEEVTAVYEAKTLVASADAEFVSIMSRLVACI